MALLAVAWMLGVWPAAASARDGWQASLRGGVVVTDQSLRRDGDTWMVSLARSFGPEQSVEVDWFEERLDFGINFGLRNRGIALNYLTFNREPLWDPYFLLGVGSLRFEAPPGSDRADGNHIFFQIGVGGEWELLLPERLLLRAEIRLRATDDATGQPGQEGYGDASFLLGLSLPF